MLGFLWSEVGLGDEGDEGDGLVREVASCSIGCGRYLDTTGEAISRYKWRNRNRDGVDVVFQIRESDTDEFHANKCSARIGNV